ncbi:hypothetical protein ACFHYQ_11590 [Sphaerimonospora cavernae]|uniref:NADP-dependent oxidoreductase domain-containing protein n=1 Tax=Sphaerimonospora cavernae TaxID=1740611 RepID=A0ABV6U3B2_9ACTN
MAGELGATRNQVVLAWLRAQEIVPIVGVRSATQLDELLTDIKLDGEPLVRLNTPA